MGTPEQLYEVSGEVYMRLEGSLHGPSEKPIFLCFSQSKTATIAWGHVGCYPLITSASFGLNELEVSEENIEKSENCLNHTSLEF
jgi:hypothetical protein